jgi:hypothetical protein
LRKIGLPAVNDATKPLARGEESLMEPRIKTRGSIAYGESEAANAARPIIKHLFELTTDVRVPMLVQGVTAMAAPLETEIKTYEKQRDRLLGAWEGKYVLIHGDEVIGAYASKMDAIMLGYQKFGNVPFLVKQVLRVETPENFVSGLIDL